VEAPRLAASLNNPPAVRTVRALFVILLALLMPLRAAVAGAMLCPTAGAAETHQQHPAMYDDSAAVEAPHDGMHHAGMHDDGMRHPGAHHDPAESSPAPHAHDGGCNLCASFCSMTPMPSTAPTIEPSMLAATLSFPTLHAPAPSFQSDGQDRPPRSR
jgi:hypothetical protein